MKKERNILAEHIALRLKELRRVKDVSQITVSFDTDINIGRLETGQHLCTINTIVKLCKYFNVTLEDFFKGVKFE